MFKRLSLEDFNSISAVQNEVDLVQYLRHHAKRLGFDSFIYGFQTAANGTGTGANAGTNAGTPAERHIFNGYPETWRNRYETKGYLEIDPVVQHCMRSTYPLLWRDELFAGPARELREESIAHGLGYGLSCPVRDWNGAAGILSLARDKPIEPDRGHLLEVLSLAQLLAGFVHTTASKLFPGTAEKPAPVDLTNRERESLQWAGRGKTAWEISKILGISERTAVFHLTNAVHKLGAANRAQAIAIALSMSLL